MHIKLSLTGFLCSTVFLFASSMSLAQTPSAAQIEQFKRLPAAQQQALAKQYGVDLKALGQSSAQPNLEQAASGNIRRAASSESTAVEDVAAESNAVKVSNSVDLTEAKKKKVTRQKLKQFGYELFDGEPGSFMPATDIPIPSEYIMGPGDNIIVQLYGKNNQSHALTINREGEIQFPNLGPMAVAGLSFTDVKALIGTTVSEQMIGVKVSVTVGKLRSIRIFILGAAKLPGSYTINSLSTMTNALFASGGISKTGSLRNIQLKRGGQLITSLDLYELLLNGDTSSDTRLLPGDVIFIPSIGKTVGVNGEVRRPAIYELKDESTSEEVVALAGGFLPTAFPQVSRIERINESGERTLVDVNLESEQGKSLLIKDADILQVFSVLDTMENVVLLEGHVKRPGGQAWHKGLHVSDVIGSVSDLQPNPDLSVAIIVRELEPTRKIEVKLFSPILALEGPYSNSDPELNARDKIIIFDYRSNREEILQDIIENISVQADQYQRRQLVSVNGSVRFPGEYPLPSNASAKDVIALAGGLTDRAFSLAAEITRFEIDAQKQQSIKHINFTLSDAASQILTAEDAIHIKRLPNWNGTETVVLEGEVVFPGSYIIQRGETLSQVIKRAGGLTEYAFIEASIFSRAQLRQLESTRLKELRQQLTSDIAAANVQDQNVGADAQIDAQQLLRAMDGMRPTGRMVIDLANIIEQSEFHDVSLKNGDRLMVPKQSQSVTVVGEVQYATSHIYDSSLSVNDYIERSGGENLKADKKRIYVVRANGSVFLPSESRWFKRGENAIQPGDTVVVPLDAERMKKLTLWGSVSEIVYRMALGAAAVASF
ncbi:MAG: ATPase [Cellvibrionales bacterium]|nr:ATPase [Cellvibrionales bacterium]